MVMDLRYLGLFVMLSVAHGKLKEFKYTIKNDLKPPFFKESTFFRITGKDKPLIRYMEESVLYYPTCTRFKSFQVELTSPYGYFVNSVNERTADYLVDKTYWALVNQTTYLPRGVSKYVPSPGEHITVQLEVRAIHKTL